MKRSFSYFFQPFPLPRREEGKCSRYAMLAIAFLN